MGDYRAHETHSKNIVGNSMNPNPAFTDPSVAKALSPEAWVALHVPRFARVHSTYVDYEHFLKAALKAISAEAAPLAVVEARAKSVPSFAEKILRKRENYQHTRDPQPPDPLFRLTDLCGGRVICQTSDQVRAVCQRIEEAFVIDWANSEDVSQRLKPSEFGYRSVHYIVQVNPERLKAAGLRLSVPASLLGFSADQVEAHAAGIPLKAEIQVRTLLEHASSMLGHDTLYKTELRMPDRVRRQYAALAAVLEGADRETDRLLATLRDFQSNSGAWHEPAEARKEIALSRVLLGLPDAHLPLHSKLSVGVRVAQLAITIGEHQQAADILLPFRHESDPAVCRILGRALVELHWNDPRHEAFVQGQEHLRRASELEPRDSESLGLLAECAAHINDDAEARKLFALAVQADGAEPLTVARYLAFEAAHQASDTSLRQASPMIRAAIDRARNQVEAHANLPAAWSALALLQLVLGKPFEAIHALAQITRLCTPPNSRDGDGAFLPDCSAAKALLELRETTRLLKCIREKLVGFDWFERFLVLAAAALANDRRAFKELARLASWSSSTSPFRPNQPIVILAGGCAPEVQPLMESFRTPLLRACEKMTFTLISGGTRSGISGLAGDLAERSSGRVQAYGYLPQSLPRGVSEDLDRFTASFSSQGTDFTPLESLQAWTDLLAAGVSPADIKVLCYAPGDIARAECAIALALGARVGLVVDPVVARDRLFDAAAWDGCRALLLIPKDAMSLRAFLQIEAKPMTDADKARLELSARMAHEDYSRSATPADPSLAPWDHLDPSLRESNYHQVLYWERTLREYGLGVRASTEEDHRQPPLDLIQALPKTGERDPILELAELEHGRWIIERLSHGWRQASEKDVNKKLSPWIIPWDAVPSDVRQFDIDAIKALPRKLREAGLEIYRL